MNRFSLSAGNSFCLAIGFSFCGGRGCRTCYMAIRYDMCAGIDRVDS